MRKQRPLDHDAILSYRILIQVERNLVAAGLVEQAGDWRWSSGAQAFGDTAVAPNHRQASTLMHWQQLSEIGRVADDSAHGSDG